MSQPVSATTELYVRPDLAPEMREHLHNLHILAGKFRAKGVTVHEKFPQLTLTVIEDQIAAITGHTHEAPSGPYCVHCGWDVRERVAETRPA